MEIHKMIKEDKTSRRAKRTVLHAEYQAAEQYDVATDKSGQAALGHRIEDNQSINDLA